MNPNYIFRKKRSDYVGEHIVGAFFYEKSKRVSVSVGGGRLPVL